MPACRTRWWRCATARWAGISRASRRTAGKSRRAPAPTPQGLVWAKSAADTVARKLGIQRIDEATLARFRAEQDRSLYLFDVRDPDEYAAGHVAGALSAPGGQLVQATDQYAGTLRARIVVIDDKAVRAVMTASWLAQMGWGEVYVLVAAGEERGFPDDPVLGTPARDAAIDCAALSGLLARNEATVIDLSFSRAYLSAHIPGSWFAIRARLEKFIQQEPLRRNVVLTSEDGVLASLAVNEARAWTPLSVRFLDGGNAAWRAAGLALTADDPRMADEPIDAWLKPYERPDGVRQAMADYLAWETDLLPRIARDGCANFIRFPGARQAE